ncbi:MAG TPA: SEC59/DGK1/VTE5 family protein [Bacteroidota bacterium]|nr:SEC59/DGK1/VTE5 family protein [Bacteroidota bacterium]
MNETATIEYKAEVVRKGIHACSLSIPIIYYFIPRELALMILAPLTIFFLVIDLARYYHKPTAEIFYKIFKWMLRSHELDEKSKRLNGATNVLIAATLCVLILPKMIFITAFTILIVSDSLAALVGRRWGRHKFFTKSFEGSLAFFLSAVAVVLVASMLKYHPADETGFRAGIGFNGYNIWIGIAAAAVGTVVEALPVKVDDNLSIPFSIGAVMWLLYLIVQ